MHAGCHEDVLSSWLEAGSRGVVLSCVLVWLSELGVGKVRGSGSVSVRLRVRRQWQVADGRWALQYQHQGRRSRRLFDRWHLTGADQYEAQVKLSRVSVRLQSNAQLCDHGLYIVSL